MEYGYTKKVKISFDDCVKKVNEELSKESFSVLFTIDIQDKLNSKLGVDFDKYVIIGACNPSFSYEVLKLEKEIGLFLPCNLIVYEKDDDIFVSTILPSVMMDITNNKSLKNISDKVEKLLKEVVDRV